MIRNLESILKKQGKSNIPVLIGDIIPISKIHKNGIFEHNNHSYSMCLEFKDINYSNLSESDKENIFIKYGNILNSLDTSVMTKVSIVNKKVDLNIVEDSIMIELKNDGNDKYRKDYNQMIKDKVLDKNYVQNKFITITVFANDYSDGIDKLNRIELELNNNFSILGSRCNRLDLNERMLLINELMAEKKEFAYTMNYDSLVENFRDDLAPHKVTFKNDYFRLGNKYGRAMYLKTYPQFLKDTFISEMCATNFKLIYSMDIITVPTDEAVREVENKFLGVEKNITDWQMKQNRNNNFSAIIPYDMELQRKECKEFLDDLIVRDQRMMMCSISLVLFSDSLDELNKNTDTLKAISRKYVCELETLYFSKRQLDGLQTSLPFGVNKLNLFRTLLTDSASVFMPFCAKDIIDYGGIWFGQNAITNNPIICNKSSLQNPNSFVLGVPGAGKSFLTKEEIEFLILSTDDDVLICDPEGEYDSIVNALGGQIVRIGTNSMDYINAMEMVEGYGDSINSIADKSQFVMSLFEQLDTKHGVSAIDRSIIDRCVTSVYSHARKHWYIPTLVHLYNELLNQPEKEAKTLATKLELFVNGSLNIFAHKTNVDIKSRILSFNIFNLGKQLKTLGLLVITDAIINRVNENWRKGKRTHIFIDEIHVIFENEESATFFASAWRQFRKRDAYPTGITQNVKYLLSSQQGISMLSNSEFIVMLNQSANDREDLAKLLNISEEQMSYITNAPIGCGLIKYGGSIVPFVNKMPKGLLYDLNTTKPCEKKRRRTR